MYCCITFNKFVEANPKNKSEITPEQINFGYFETIQTENIFN